ncbi:chloride channel protein [Beijerinckia sp. L45]|uniref:chloride channel protein n=1 Tax=Beijerinckia sp. L45 TaxID=1641855 RepID=UPI00131E3CCC|nr:chloride channel protein [Beijerinckia sp. L45]
MSVAAPPAIEPKQGVLARFVMRLRVLVRQEEIGLITLSVVAGAMAGAAVTALSQGARLLHIALYGLDGQGSLSAMVTLHNPWQAAIPALGGLVLGLVSRLLAHWRRRRPVDPIEANALQGGRMSVTDSLLIGGQTLISNGAGASVGLEAAYTQVGSGLASYLGASFNLRRADLRTLVGAGSAGAIAAAFGAPLTGAFYAFELIIGSYTPFGLAPVVAAAISGVLVSRALGTGDSFIGQIASDVTLQGGTMVALLLLSLACAAIGIGIMRLVGLIEALFKRSPVPAFLQPAAGGVVLGALALITPRVLSAGHGAFAELIHGVMPTLLVLALTLLLKALASAVSIGSGFRGGLFFASLYLGGLVGKLFYALLLLVGPVLPIDDTTCAIVGMAALSVTIVGGPLTMSFLALETTGDFPLSILILAAATVVSVIVRRTFGYSFTTWRLHLRGESIKSGQDVGWIRGLTVRRLMRPDVDTIFADVSIATFVATHPLGSTYWVVATDPFGRYVGMVSVAEAHQLTSDPERAKDHVTALLRHPMTALTPDLNIREAARLFEQSESEALAVTESTTDRSVIGLLTEAHVLRRYTEELDKARQDLTGEKWIGEG